MSYQPCLTFNLLLIASLALGCNQEPEQKFVKATEVKGVAESNAVRSEIGLRLIKDDWLLCPRDEDYPRERIPDDWRSNSDDWKAEPAGGFVKRVFKDKAGIIVQEEDDYYSGAKYYDETDGGRFEEFVSVNYDYTTRQVRVSYSGANKKIMDRLAPFDSYSSKVKEALAAVDSVVKEWPQGYR